MNTTPSFYQISPRTADLERLDIQGISDDWTSLRALLHHDLAALDHVVSTAVPRTRVRVESNQGGGAHLFVYRVYESGLLNGIDPVVVGILIRPVADAPSDHFAVSGDIAGESRGDILFEAKPREVIGWTSLTEAARDVATELVCQDVAVIAALQDASRQE
jgi:hypothetical protein